MFRNIAIALASSAVIATPLAAQTAAPPVDQKFVQQLRAAFDQNPMLFFEIANKAQNAQRELQTKSQNEKVENVRPTLFAKAAVGPVIGNPNGTKTVVELLDYACPFCKRAHTLVDQISDQDKDVRFVIVMRPVLGPESETLARFALAADLQGKFRAAHDALYEKFGDDHQTHATDDNLKEVAQKAGVDWERAKRDMTSDAVVQKLSKHNSIADQMEVRGTPFFAGPKSVIPGAPQSAQQLEALLVK